MTRFGAAVLLGVGAIAFDLMLLSSLGIEWTAAAVLVSLVVIAGLAVGGWAWHSRSPRARCPLPPASPFQWIFDLLTLTIVASYAIFATWVPPYEWDFFGIWGSKARAFFEAGGIHWEVLKIVEKPDYPPLIPLLFDFVAVVTGGWNERLFGWVYVVLCTAVILIMRGMFAEEVRWPALATLAVAFPTLNLWVGLAEAGVMAFGCAGVLFIRRGNVYLGAVFLALAAWSKNEGLALIAVTAVALLVSTRSIRRVFRLWPAAAVIAPWLITRSALGLTTDFMEGSVTVRVFERLGKLDEVARAFIASPPDQPWFWLAVFLTLVVFIREAIRRELFLLIVVVLQFGLMVAQALATKWDLAMHVNLTMNRLPQQIAPLAGFLAVSLLIRVVCQFIPRVDAPEGSKPTGVNRAG